MSLHHVYVVTGISHNGDNPNTPFFTQSVFQFRKDADTYHATLKELAWESVIVRWEIVQ